MVHTDNQGAIERGGTGFGRAYQGADPGTQDIDGHEAHAHHSLDQERVCQHECLVWNVQSVVETCPRQQRSIPPHQARVVQICHDQESFTKPTQALCICNKSHCTFAVWTPKH